MHIPSKFKQNEESILLEIIREYPFATLITNTESGIDATHFPVIIANKEGKNSIQAHIAKANKIWESVKNGAEVLLVFNGPNCYISPNYYPTKVETGKAVPTWNYVVVHVKGRISFIHDEKWIYNMIDSLTNEHESTQKIPWSISDAPESYINKMLPAIVGIEVSIDSIEGQWKLSQNQPDINKFGVIKGLLDKGELKVSELVNQQIHANK
jgi:transcriptional regulator